MVSQINLDGYKIFFAKIYLDKKKDIFDIKNKNTRLTLPEV